MRIKGKIVFSGIVEGQLVVSKKAISFLGGVDVETGVIRERGHPLEGIGLKGKILLLPRGKGSTVGSYTLYQMKKNGVAPSGIFSVQGDEMVVSGAIISEIPMLYEPRGELLNIPCGKRAILNAKEGYLEVQD